MKNTSENCTRIVSKALECSQKGILWRVREFSEYPRNFYVCFIVKILSTLLQIVKILNNDKFNIIIKMKNKFNITKCKKK